MSNVTKKKTAGPEMTFLGKGQFGSVYKVCENGLLFARKIINYSRTGKAKFRQITSEIDILKQLNFRYLIHYYNSQIIQEKEEYWIDTEYCEGKDLQNLLGYCDNSEIYLSNSQAIRLFLNIAHGIEYLFHLNLAHRDLKPDNIFLSGAGECVIGDVGISKFVVDDILTTKLGTPIYMSPEVYNGFEYTIKCDVYSLGLILYALFSNHPPNYWCQNNIDLRKFLSEMRLEPLPPHVDQRILPIVRSMMSPEVVRPSIHQILENDIFKEYLNNDIILNSFDKFCFPLKPKVVTSPPTPSIRNQKNIIDDMTLLNRSYFIVSITLEPVEKLQSYKPNKYSYLGFFTDLQPIPKLNLHYFQFLENILDDNYISTNFFNFGAVIPLKRITAYSSTDFPAKLLSTKFLSLIMNIYVVILRYLGYEIYRNIRENYIVAKTTDFNQRLETISTIPRVAELYLMIIESMNDLALFKLQSALVRRILFDVAEKKLPFLETPLVRNFRKIVSDEKLIQAVHRMLSQ